MDGREHWVFFKPCGHAHTMVDVSDWWPTEERAWLGAYDTAAQAATARREGVTLDRLATARLRGDIYRQLLTGCSCAMGVE